MSANTPSAYKAEYCELVKDLMRDGASFARFRAEVGIAKSTFYLWRKTYPEFEEACEIANALSCVWWENIALTGVTAGAPKGSAPLILAGLYNRGAGDWSNKQEVEQKVTTTDANALDLTKLSDEELKAYELLVTARERLAGGDQPA